MARKSKAEDNIAHNSKKPDAQQRKARPARSLDAGGGEAPDQDKSDTQVLFEPTRNLLQALNILNACGSYTYDEHVAIVCNTLFVMGIHLMALQDWAKDNGRYGYPVDSISLHMVGGLKNMFQILQRGSTPFVTQGRPIQGSFWPGYPVATQVQGASVTSKGNTMESDAVLAERLQAEEYGRSEYPESTPPELDPYGVTHHQGAHVDLQLLNILGYTDTEQPSDDNDTDRGTGGGDGDNLTFGAVLYFDCRQCHIQLQARHRVAGLADTCYFCENSVPMEDRLRWCFGNSPGHEVPSRSFYDEDEVERSTCSACRMHGELPEANREKRQLDVSEDDEQYGINLRKRSKSGAQPRNTTRHTITLPSKGDEQKSEGETRDTSHNLGESAKNKGRDKDIASMRKGKSARILFKNKGFPSNTITPFRLHEETVALLRRLRDVDPAAKYTFRQQVALTSNMMYITERHMYWLCDFATRNNLSHAQAYPIFSMQALLGDDIKAAVKECLDGSRVLNTEQSVVERFWLGPPPEGFEPEE